MIYESAEVRRTFMTQFLGVLGGVLLIMNQWTVVVMDYVVETCST